MGIASLMIVLPIVVAKDGCEVKRHTLPVPPPCGYRLKVRKALTCCGFCSYYVGVSFSSVYTASGIVSEPERRGSGSETTSGIVHCKDLSCVCRLTHRLLWCI